LANVRSNAHPSQGRKPLLWDVTVVSTLVSATAFRVGINPKSGKYARLPVSYVFKPIAIESLGSLSESATISGFWSQNQFSHRRWPRRCVSLSTAVGHTATFQWHSVAPELCREWGVGSSFQL